MKNDLLYFDICPIHNSCRVYTNIVYRACAAPRNENNFHGVFSLIPLMYPNVRVNKSYYVFLLNCYDKPTVIHFTRDSHEVLCFIQRSATNLLVFYSCASSLFSLHVSLYCCCCLAMFMEIGWL